MHIANSVALVTGANRGIGRAFVEILLSVGARRIYAAARNAALLEPLVALDRARIIPLKLDITNQQEAQTAAQAASDVNLLIKNAGVLASGSLLLSDIGSLRQDIDTNYLGTLNVIRNVAPVIERNGGGSIVNVLTLIALASAGPTQIATSRPERYKPAPDTAARANRDDAASHPCTNDPKRNQPAPDTDERRRRT